MIREQLEIGADEQQNLASTEKVNQDNQLVAETQHWVALDENRLLADRARLQREVISSYVNFEYSSAVTPLFQNQSVTQLKEEYEGVVFGDTALAIDQLNTASSVLIAERSWLQRQELADQNLQEGAVKLVDEAQRTESQLQSQQSQVNGQLAAVIAAQQAAAAAQAAAARAVISETVAGPLPGPVDPPSSNGTTVDPTLNFFLTCARQAESSGNYGAVSPNGVYMGAFQFSQPTWNEAATLAGLPGLVGVPPNSASQADQDTLAVTLYNADGEQPWSDSCRS